jgi:nucleoid-associated protein YgaU
MLVANPNGPMSIQPRSPGLGKNSHSLRFAPSRRFAAPAILFLSCVTFCASISRAQDQQDPTVAEAARQEQARKQELQKRAKHVYTEEDLKHPNILTPEDRAQVEAKRSEIEAKRTECVQKNNCAPAKKSPESLDANSQQPSLGEVARQLRKQKELQALKPKQQEPFHLPSTPALASPILPERPAVRPPAQPVLRTPAQPTLRSPAQPLLHPKTPSNVFRRDPFSAIPVPEVRRPEARNPEVLKPEVAKPEVAKSEVAKPEVRRPEILPSIREDVRPTLRSHGRMTAPAAPKFSARPATPGVLIQPAQPSVPVELAQPAKPVAPVSKLRPVQPKPSVSPATVASQGTVTVRSGDSLWKLAHQVLGRGNRWPELLALNPSISDPNQIQTGTRLNLPVVAAASLNRLRDGQNTPTSTLKVRRGDTLWALAKSNLGRFADWPCLAAANPLVADPNRIFEGQGLVVPSACGAARNHASSSAARN